MAQAKHPTLTEVVQRVQAMVYDQNAVKLIRDHNYSIQNVSWEDCARDKNSCWGPCISDMTLQVGNARMPVIRKDNFTDLTWDVRIENIPIVIGNEQTSDPTKLISEQDEKQIELSNPNSNSQKSHLKTITLKEYLKNFDKYATSFIRNNPNSNSSNSSNNKNPNSSSSSNFMTSLFGGGDTSSSKASQGLHRDSINLLRKDESKDSHCIVSSQACLLPIESGKETLFNVALFNYESRWQDPAILAIIATSKGTSSQIIEGSEQKLLFNNYGKKADFIGQRLSDNREERGIINEKELEAPMTMEEKQDNIVVIVQVPLKQKKRPKPKKQGAFMAQMELESASMKMYDKCENNRNESNVEAAIVKVAPRTHPICKCGDELEKLQVQFCYENYGKPENEMARVNCDECGIEANGKDAIVWHCKKEKKEIRHKDGYDLCQNCALKQLEFDELNGMNKIERDERYPIRVTLQYYKATDNGVITKKIMREIAKELEESQKRSDYVGSLVTERRSGRPTEWVKRFLPFIVDNGKGHNGSNSNSNSIDNNNNNNNNINIGNRNVSGYELIRDILGNLRLSEYYNCFVKNEINDSRLILLEDRDLERLFDKIGPQIVFRHWLRSYKGTNGNKNDGTIVKDNENLQDID